MNVERVLNWSFEDVVQSYTLRDAQLYALSTGFGADPLDAGQLPYVYEREPRVTPTLAAVLGNPGPSWGAAAGIRVRQVVHAGYELELHGLLPPQATIRARERVAGLFDKGAEKGALLCTERLIVDDATGSALATVRSSVMCRGDGGFGSSHGEERPLHRVPDRTPDRVIEMASLPQQALLYRLNGDLNPLHADPAAAAQAGFAQPILHGLCSYGFAAHALLRLWCDYDASLLKSVAVRFSAPMLPGETFVIETWRDGDVASFRAWSRERGAKVLDGGRAIIGRA